MKNIFKELVRERTKSEIEKDLIFIEKIKKFVNSFCFIFLFVIFFMFNLYCFYKFYFEQSLIFGILLIISFVLLNFMNVLGNEIDDLFR